MVVDFYSTFHVFDGAACLYKLSRLISLDLISPLFHHGYDTLFYYRRQFIYGDLSPYSWYSISIFRQTDLSQEAITLTADVGGLGAGCHTHSDA